MISASNSTQPASTWLLLSQAGLLDDQSVGYFNRIARRLVDACGGAAGYVSLFTETTQFIRGSAGLSDPPRSRPIDASLCARTLTQGAPLVLNDLTDTPALPEDSLIIGHGFKAYLGVPLIAGQYGPVGTLCLTSSRVRSWSDDDVQTLQDFAAFAEAELDRRLQHHTPAGTLNPDSSGVFEPLLESVIDLVSATILDDTGHIQFVSPSLQDLLGYEPGELEHTSLFQHVHPDDRSNLQTLLSTASADDDQPSRTEFRVRHADGSWRTLETKGRWLPDNVDLGTFVGIANDVTDTREFETNARLLATAVETAKTGVLITGPQLTAPGPEIQYANQAMTELTGYSKEALIGQSPRLLQGPKTDRDVLDRLKQQLASGNPFRGTTVNYHKDGSSYYVQWHIAPIRDDDGVITHFVSVQEDVTHRKEQEHVLEQRVAEHTQELRHARLEAEKANRLKSAFLTNMSHEIRTPLTSIIGFAESIEEQASEADHSLDSISRFATLIERSGLRLLDTLNSVLNLSMLDANEMEVTPQPVDVTAMLKDLPSLAGVASPELEFVLDLPDQSLCGAIDPDAFQIVFGNLISNAVKFTPKGGTITIRAYDADEEVVIEIADTGCGMEPDQVPALFEAFQQGSAGLARTHEGPGLGLTVVRRLMDRMEGTLDIDTEKDKGTCVTLRLPSTDPDA